MNINTLGICITVVVGVIAIALALFFGFRGFANSLGEKITNVKNDVILELAGIKDNIIRIEEKASSLWDLFNVYVSQRQAGTVTLQLNNFGKTRIWAEPKGNETSYWIQVEKGKLNPIKISEVSRKSGFAEKELKLFGSEPKVDTMGANMLRVAIPSNESKKCVQYINMFIKWLDTEYFRELMEEIKAFEEGIQI